MSKDNTIVKNLIDLNNNKYLISIHYSNPQVELDDSEDNININIGIAAAITSYARIYMSTFLSKIIFDVCYTDTDSIFT